MGLKTETSRSGDELAGDLAELAAVDWAQVWRGYSDADPLTWCAQRGWQLAQLDRVENMTARLRSGGLLYLSQDRRQAENPIAVTSAEEDCWRAESESPDDNGALFTAAEEVWLDYVAAASETVGAPAVVTSFDDPAFPDLPDWSPQERASRRRPYRLALWAFNGASAQLYISPSANALTIDRRGGIQTLLWLRPAGAAAASRGA